MVGAHMPFSSSSSLGLKAKGSLRKKRKKTESERCSPLLGEPLALKAKEEQFLRHCQSLMESWYERPCDSTFILESHACLSSNQLSMGLEAPKIGRRPVFFLFFS